MRRRLTPRPAPSPPPARARPARPRAPRPALSARGRAGGRAGAEWPDDCPPGPRSSALLGASPARAAAARPRGSSPMVVAHHRLPHAFQVAPGPLTVALRSRGVRLRFSAAFWERRRGPAQALAVRGGGWGRTPKSPQRLWEREPEGPPHREELANGRRGRQHNVERPQNVNTSERAARHVRSRSPQPGDERSGAGGSARERASAPLDEVRRSPVPVSRRAVAPLLPTAPSQSPRGKDWRRTLPFSSDACSGRRPPLGAGL